jgi:hypothetical protein
MSSNRLLRYGGIGSGIVLIAFGIVVIVLALGGHRTVSNELKQQQITGTPDMTPAAISGEVAKAGLHGVQVPRCDVAGKPIDSGNRARCFAEYMNIHALLSTGGYVYSQMGIYQPKPETSASQLEPGGGTNNPDYAVIDQNGKPTQNAARNVWVTETALATALNVSYMASALSLFSLVVGIALVLAGTGFVILAMAALPRPGKSGPEVAA